MSFINVSKVELNNNENIEVMMGDVMLLCASLVHDDVIKKQYKEAVYQVKMLKCSIEQLEYVLTHPRELKKGAN